MADPFVGKPTSGGTADKAVDAAEVRRALSILADPTGEVELRAVARSGSCSSVVRKAGDLPALVDAARKLSHYKSVYVGLNPVELGAPCKRKASDEHVVRRRWLFVDVDAIRPRDVCATADEKKAAAACAEGVKDHLAELGWPEPVEADSGNGHY